MRDHIRLMIRRRLGHDLVRARARGEYLRQRDEAARRESRSEADANRDLAPLAPNPDPHERAGWQPVSLESPRLED